MFRYRQKSTRSRLRAPGIMLLAATALLAGAPARSPSARASSGAAEGGWSSPLRLGGCASSAPTIAFPSTSPATPSGAGAIAWLEGGARCAGARSSLALSWLDAGDSPVGRPAVLPDGFSARSLLAAGASEGRVATVEGGGGKELTRQGRAPGPPPPASRLSGVGEVAIARGYLDDVAVVALSAGQALEVSVERHYAATFAPWERIPIGPGAVTSLTAAMDFRSDLLLVWQQSNSIYGLLVHAGGHAARGQRIGPSGPHPQLQALLSDDNRGIVGWSTTSAVSGRTAVRIAFSRPGVRFAGARAVAQFSDPADAGRLAGSLALVRLANENVMMGWTERVAGRYAALVAPAVYAGVRPAEQLSPAGSDAALAAMAAGPAGEAVALWRRLGGLSSSATAAGWSGAQLFASRVFFVPGDRVGALSGEALPGASTPLAPALAVDPANDTPVAAWLAGDGSIESSAGPAAAAYRPQTGAPLPVADR